MINGTKHERARRPWTAAALEDDEPPPAPAVDVRSGRRVFTDEAIDFLARAVWLVVVVWLVVLGAGALWEYCR